MPAEPAPVPSALPLVRECRPGGLRPLLAPGGRDTFFSPDVQRMLFTGDEPIARFLPPAKYSMPDRQERTQEGRGAQVVYTVPDEILKTATRMTTLARAEIDAFAAAVTLFLAKAQPDAKDVPPYIRQCRQEFRLPNPDIDADAYWVYGPEFDRRLLILWGCEPQAGTSLSLDKVLAKLRAREMSWQDKQALGLKLALRPDEPLSRFLAQRAADGGLVANGMTIAPKKLRRVKTIVPGEWRAFQAAAEAYYAKAHPDFAATAPFEKEVRRDFQLASFTKVPGDYYLHGSKLVIALDTWPRDTTLPLTEDAALKLPEPAPAPASAVAVLPAGPATVAAELRDRQQPAWVLYAKLGGVAAALVAVGVGAWLLKPDRTPPQFERIDAPDRRTLTIAFNKPLSAESLQPRVVQPGQPAVDPIVVLPAGSVELISRGLRTGDARVVVVHTKSDLKDGETYDVALKNITDATSNHNPIPPLTQRVSFFDTVAPALSGISAGGPNKRYLVLLFSKPVGEDSLARSRFVVCPVVGTERGKSMRVDASLDPNDKSGTTVLLKADDEFEEGRPYVIDITGVKDRAAKPNPLDEKSATNRAFEYVNTLPPRLNEIVATGGRYEIKASFGSALDATSATEASAYVITGPDGKPLRIAKVEVPAPFTDVVLRLAPARLADGPHKLRVEKLVGKNRVALVEPIEREFTFNDRPKPPTIDKAEMTSPTRLRLTSDRIVSADTVNVPANYRILDRDGRPTEINVRSADPASDDPTRIVLALSRAPTGGKYYVETSGLADVFGTKQETATRCAFEIKGGGDIVQSLIAWSAPPVLRDGGRVLVLSIRGRLRELEARNIENYDFEPQLAGGRRVETVQLAAEGARQTTVTIRFDTPAKPPLVVAAHGLVLEAAPGRGGQTLAPQEAVQ